MAVTKGCVGARRPVVVSLIRVVIVIHRRAGMKIVRINLQPCPRRARDETGGEPQAGNTMQAPPGIDPALCFPRAKYIGAVFNAVGRIPKPKILIAVAHSVILSESKIL